MGGLNSQKPGNNSLEYLVTRLPNNGQKGKKAQTDQAAQEFLNNLGDEGWRLIGVDGDRVILVKE